MGQSPPPMRGQPLGFTSRHCWTGEEPFPEKSVLFITAGTFQKRPFFADADQKQTLLESLDFNCFKWKWRLLAYCVCDNHYHMVVQTPAGDASRLAHIVQSAHSFSAYHLRRCDPSIRSRIWWNFWETPIADEEGLIRHILYVHDNPRRHGMSKVGIDYPFSSHADYHRTQPESLDQWEKRYSIDDLPVIDDF